MQPQMQRFAQPDESCLYILKTAIMRRFMKKSFIFYLSLLIFGSFHDAANAYVLKGIHILDLMIRNLGKDKRLLVSQKLVFHGSNPERESIELYETLRYVFPETFRSDIFSGNTQRINIVSKGIVLTVIDQKIVTESETKFDYYKDILLYHSRILIKNRLSLLGVDVSVSSLGRFHDKIAYVIGAEYPEESTSQLWVDKESFLPIRWLIIGKSGERDDDFLEIRYLKWRKIKKTWYPMRIELFQNDVLVREIKVNNIKVNPFFHKDLFDIRKLKLKCLSAVPVLPSKYESSEFDDVRETIEDFRKMFE